MADPLFAIIIYQTTNTPVYNCPVSQLELADGTAAYSDQED